MGYSTTPRKMQRTSTGKRRRGKSQPRKLFSAGPSRTLVSRSGMPEVKRIDSTMGVPTGGFSSHSCFHTMRGTGNDNRIGNSLNMKAIKVKFDLSNIPVDVASPTKYSIYLIRDTEPTGLAPQDAPSWRSALFADPVSTDWRTNFRNTDYTERLQIVRKWDANGDDYKNGIAPLHGYLELPLNGAIAKYTTGESSQSYPLNTRYYVLYWSGTTFNSQTPVIRIREEFTD